jgi:hypothetical protein
MADAGLSDLKELLGDVLDKLTSLETKLTAVDGELSTVKIDQRRLHDAVKAEKQAAFPGVLELRLPEYDGTDDPDIWLHRFEIFFDLQRTEEEKKVCLAAFHMTGKAQIWYYGVERNRGVPAWTEFAESVRRRFGSLTRSNDAFRELIQLRHTGSVAEYREEFLGLVDRCDGVSEPMQLAFFTAGLRHPLRADVELRRPETLQDAAWMAGVLEHREELGFEN